MERFYPDLKPIAVAAGIQRDKNDMRLLLLCTIGEARSSVGSAGLLSIAASIGHAGRRHDLSVERQLIPRLRQWLRAVGADYL